MLFDALVDPARLALGAGRLTRRQKVVGPFEVTAPGLHAPSRQTSPRMPT
jgi:hypothetical protein